MSNQPTRYTLICLSALGLISNLLMLVPNLIEKTGTWIIIVIYACSPYQLQFFDSSTMINVSENIYHSINLVEVSFFLLLLVATVLWYASRETETRLAAFVLGVIFINQISCLFMNFMWLGHVLLSNQFQWSNMVSHSITLLTQGIYAWVAYNALKPLLNRATPALLTHSYDDFEVHDVMVASHWVRLVHLIIDIMIIIFTFSPFLLTWPKEYLQHLQPLLGDRMIIYGYFAVAGFIYYPITEWLFGATPAKLLTNTTILDEEGNTPKPITMFWRTVCRRIPFNGVSFLGTRGWHDKYTGTQVVYLKTDGVDGRHYWWLLAGIIVFNIFVLNYAM